MNSHASRHKFQLRRLDLSKQSICFVSGAPAQSDSTIVLGLSTNVSGGTPSISNISITGPAVTTTGTGDVYDVVTFTSVSNVDVSKVSAALGNVATYRASNGSNQSRLSYSAEMLVTNKANLDQAASRISDVDLAEENAALAKNNVLVQAGTSMQPQANQTNQISP